MAQTILPASASPRNPQRIIDLTDRLAVARIEMGMVAHLLAVALLEKAGARAQDTQEVRHG